MRIVAVVPARMASRRFPGKPLATIRGLTMLEHVYRRARLCGSLSEVHIATCDREIEAAAKGFGAPVIMTSDRHTRCTERVAEAAARLDADVVVNVQGDEPLLRPEMIDEVVAPFREGGVVCTTIVSRIEDEREVESRDVVKVVLSRAGDVLYFSREPIPSRKMGVEPEFWKQAGIYAFERRFLLELDDLPETPLERAESVDLLRALEHGYRVRGVPSRHVSLGVDTPEDLVRAEAAMAADPLVERYAAQR